MSKTNLTQEELNHHSNQLNSNNQAFQDRMNNHADQLNSNNEKFQEEG